MNHGENYYFCVKPRKVGFQSLKHSEQKNNNLQLSCRLGMSRSSSTRGVVNICQVWLHYASGSPAEQEGGFCFLLPVRIELQNSMLISKKIANQHLAYHPEAPEGGYQRL